MDNQRLLQNEMGGKNLTLLLSYTFNSFSEAVISKKKVILRKDDSGQFGA